MNYDEYLSRVRANFSGEEDVAIGDYNTKMFYDEQFKVTWLATKMKIFSFVAYVPQITAGETVHYSEVCLAHALDVYKGLPRGFQNGVASFNVLVSEKVDAEAKDIAQQCPKKHYAAMEMPVVYDLSSKSIYYYEKTPMWGAIYYKYFREYVEKNFHVK